MNNLQIFENTEFGNVRMVEVDGKPYAVGVDVARALEYANPSKAVLDHCRGISKLGIPSYNQHGAEVVQETNIIPEGDIYRLIIKAADQSRNPVIKEKAGRFERWVFDEVLPSIRKYGLYAVDQLLDDPDLAIRAFTALKEERAKRLALETENAGQKQTIIELSPKASYYDLVLQSKDVLSVSKIAKDYGKSAQWLNEYLHLKGVQYKQGTVWLIYQKYAEHGYTKTKTHLVTGDDGEQHSKIHTYWTQSGRMFIYTLLKDQGILPLIERNDAVEPTAVETTKQKETIHLGGL